MSVAVHTPTFRRLPPRTAGGMAALLLAAFHLTAFATNEVADAIAARDNRLSHSADGHVWVISEDAAARLILLKWADDVVGRFEHTLDLPWRADHRRLRIVVRGAAAGASLETAQHIAERTLIQSLVVADFERLDRREADVALCRLLLWAQIIETGLDQRVPAATNLQTWLSVTIPAATPEWLPMGLAGNLYGARRAAHSSRLLQDWQTAAAPTPAAFLRMAAEGRAGAAQAVGAAAFDREAYAAMLVAWLLERPDREALLQDLLGRLARAQALTPEWLLTLMPNCDSPADLDAQWDRWVLAQKRRVFATGGVSAADVAALKSELVVRPGVSGIPLEGSPDEEQRLRRLIARRGEDWIPPFAENKATRLRTLALGKHERFQDVVERYCAFLSVLRDQPWFERRLRRLLDEADSALYRLEEWVDGELADTAGPPRDQTMTSGSSR